MRRVRMKGKARSKVVRERMAKGEERSMLVNIIVLIDLRCVQGGSALVKLVKLGIIGFLMAEMVFEGGGCCYAE